MPPRWLDVPLRGLKYALLALFLYVVGSMSIPALEAFLAGQYGLIADVKMLNFFRFMSVPTVVTLSVLVVFSVFVPNLWCRYVCPYGALMGLFALASPIRIERQAARCIDCGICSKSCPSNLPVESLVQIRSAECNICFECVDACPEEGALQATLGIPILKSGRKTPLSAVAIAAGIAIVFLGTVGMAKATGHWETTHPIEIYRQLIPNAQKISHPGR
jgi:polyferredoxin